MVTVVIRGEGLYYFENGTGDGTPNNRFDKFKKPPISRVYLRGIGYKSKCKRARYTTDKGDTFFVRVTGKL